MDEIELIKNNFLKVSYKYQQQILEYLRLFLNENKLSKLSKDFDGVFENYIDRIKLLLEFKDSYNDYKSDDKRLIRKRFLEDMKTSFFYHHSNNSDEELKRRFYYSGEDIEEYNKYFKSSKISSKDVHKFLFAFSNLDISKKYVFIEDIILFYKRIDFFTVPNPDKLLDEYDLIVRDIIGDELTQYYQKLYSEEKIGLIFSVVDNFNALKNDVDYYNDSLKTIKDNKKIIRLLKKDTIECCERKLH